MSKKRTASPASPASGFWHDLGDVTAHAIRVVRRGAWPLAAVLLVTQLAVAVWAAPGIRWLFGEAVRSAGGIGLDGGAGNVGLPLTAALLIATCAVTFVLVATQLLVLLVAVRRVRTGERLLSRDAVGELVRVMRRTGSPSGLLLAAYLLLLLPLTGLGFVSVLTKAVAVPGYVTAEITSTIPGVIGYGAALIVLGVVSTRLALTLPLFVVEEVSAARAMALSWRLTRGRPDALLTVACLSGLLLGGVVAILLAIVAVVPTAVADLIAPEASIWVAAAGLGLAEVAAVAVGGFAVLLLASGLLELLARGRPHPRVTPTAPATPPRAVWRTLLTPAIIIAAMIGGATAVNVPAMRVLASQPDTLIGVEADASATAEDSIAAAAPEGADVTVRIASADQPSGHAVALLREAIESGDDPRRLIVASPDERVIRDLSREHPEAMTAIVLAHPALSIPRTAADAVLITHASATSELVASAHDAGLGVIVAETPVDAVHALVRDGTDVILAADPVAAARERDAIAEESGLAAALVDIVFRFVVIF